MIFTSVTVMNFHCQIILSCGKSLNSKIWKAKKSKIHGVIFKILDRIFLIGYFAKIAYKKVITQVPTNTGIFEKTKVKGKIIKNLQKGIDNLDMGMLTKIRNNKRGL